MRQALKFLAESRPSVVLMDAFLAIWLRLVGLLKPLDNSHYKVTVVVPAYNVEKYIEQTLRSVQAQKYSNLRVIVVDDQSTDETFLRASRFLTKLDLILVKGSQEGPGGARNLGVSSISETDYLLFLDGDDVMAPGAISGMVRLAQKYSADMVNGQSVKFLGLALFPRKDTRFLYRGTTDELHTIESKPGMIYDSAVCNKLISWKFWIKHSLSWPVGVYFEDLILAAEIFTLGAKTALTPSIVHFWRVRVRTNKSITQTHHDVRTLRDRVSAARAATTIMQNALRAGRISTSTVGVFQQKLLHHDLPLYIDKHPSPSGEAKDLLDELAKLAGASK
jgi:CDP-glycerol glycerophosphotransferase